MIHKASEYKNGYIFGPSSTDKDFQEILKSYPKVNCIICNEKKELQGWNVYKPNDYYQ